MKTYYLAIDIGASSGRHILGTLEGGKLGLQEIYRFQNGFESQKGHLVWNIKRLEQEVLFGIKKCAEIGKIPVSISIDTWGVDYILLDKDKNVLEPVFSYRDNRTNAVIKELESKISFENLYRETGIQKQKFNTIYQLYCDSKSGKLQNAKYFLMFPSYFSYVLTGVMKNEYTDATTTGLVNAKTNEWDADILNAIEAPKELFKPFFMPTSFVGNFKEEIKQYVGFDACVVLCPSHDTASAVAACPLNINRMYISSGTWSLIGKEIKKPILTDDSRIKNFTNEGGIEYRFRYLKNYTGMWLFQNVRKNLNKNYTYDEMMQMAEESSYVAYFDVNDNRLTTSDNMIDTVKELLENPNLSLGDTINCIYHSLAKSYKKAVDEVERLTENKIDSILIVGGGSKDKYLNKLTASYTGKKVLTGLNEATAIGNLLSQIMAHEGITLEKARNLILNSFPITEVLP